LSGNTTLCLLSMRNNDLEADEPMLTALINTLTLRKNFQLDVADE
jgi:hypothetical protein